MKKIQRGLFQILSLWPILLLMVCWQVISVYFIPIAKRSLYPAPTQCWTAFLLWLHSGQLAIDLIASGKRLLFGLLIGISLGLLVGVLTGRLRLLSILLSPILNLARPLTPVALIPLFILWFGIDDKAKAITISYAVFFPVWLNTASGIQNIPKKLLWSAGTLTKSRFKNIFWVVLPAALQQIFVGLRLAIGVAFTMVFVSELQGSEAGLGVSISNWQLAYRMDSMIAGLIILGATGAVADWLFITVMYRIFPWLRLGENTTSQSE